MGKSQRSKGQGYETEVVNTLKAAGIEAKRNLTQTREGGGDIDLGRYMLECKRRKSIAVYDWLDQCTKACTPAQTPVVVARGDRRESVVIMRLVEWIELMKGKS
jgi:hypothetical protein